MPARVEIRTGVVKTIGGIPYTLIATRENLAVLCVACETDGLIDGPDEVKTAANRWRKQFDRPPDGAQPV
jgi:hypothetical protein